MMHKLGDKILVLGCSGSGKSTLTRALAKKLNLPVIHMDIHFWNENWVETPKVEWREKVKKLSEKNQWIMDGTFSSSLDLRFPFADTIIILNFSRVICLYRAIRRVFKYSKKYRRSDMAIGCDEKVDFDFYKYIWKYNQKTMPRIMDALDEYDCRHKVIYLNNNHELKSFLKNLI
ncbi:MAG: hypothetical protein COB02_03080 [Candidatus Cloacimonadota bacterium]|nr:MAG: hypothetical protein COB02_03080 [Candidatus Cloacimonadota bacterium]